ncbi:hypothetical protein ACFQ7F_35440 [Streptomyces sp. NPDC056486]|uniref:hypothetical protein n=1 Tax=Streptomyces sp. NPDC056486 TaxID=3345835 RepID=UPI00368CBF22
MPSHIDDILAQVAVDDDVFTEADLDNLRQEVVRDVTEILMFGAVPAPAGYLPTVHGHAATRLDALSTQVLHHRDAAGRLARFVTEGPDPEGTLHFACLLSLAGCHDGAQFWWQFSGGAGNAVAAQCLHLHHLSRGEVRDAEFWEGQAITFAGPPAPPAPRAPWARRPATASRGTRLPKQLHDAVRRLKVDTVEEFGMGCVPHPDPDLADQVEELADAL